MHPLLKDSLAGQVAFVTGAGSGIGKATAKLLAHAGARVAALAWDKPAIEATCEEIQAAGGQALCIHADVSDETQMETAVRRTLETWSRIDLVVANAGINGLWAPVEEISGTEWDKTFAVNLKGTFLTAKHTVPHLKAHGGAIVIVSSVNGTRIFSNAGASAYATSKAGQLAFGRMLALELAPWRIRVNTICPGSTDTRIFETTRVVHIDQIRPAAVYPDGDVPLSRGKIGSPEQVADVVWFLCSPLASHVTGAEIFVDGAESLLKG